MTVFHSVKWFHLCKLPGALRCSGLSYAVSWLFGIGWSCQFRLDKKPIVLVLKCRDKILIIYSPHPSHSSKAWEASVPNYLFKLKDSLSYSKLPPRHLGLCAIVQLYNTLVDSVVQSVLIHLPPAGMHIFSIRVSFPFFLI